MVRYGLDYVVRMLVGIMFCGIDNFLYKIVCC